jgi:hypothetical protein
MGKKRNACRILEELPDERDHQGYLNVEYNKMEFSEKDGLVRTGFIWHRTDTSEGLYKYGKEASRSI